MENLPEVLDLHNKVFSFLHLTSLDKLTNIFKFQ